MANLLDHRIVQAVKDVQPFFTPGEQARRRHPGLSILYAWPFETAEVARFLASQIGLFISKPS